MVLLTRTLAAWAAFWLLVAAGPAAAQDFNALARAEPAGSLIEDAPGGGARLTLELSQGVPWRLFTLSDPDRLVMDFREVDWSALDAGAVLRPGRISAVRFGGFRPGWSRLVADLAVPLAVTEAGLRVAPDGGGARLEVRLAPVSEAEFHAASGAPQDPRWDYPRAARVPAARTRPDGLRPLVVVLDPGHGGIDPGAQVAGVTEADLMLTMARELRETLLRAGGFEVVLTRQDDSFVSLERRVALAHRARADVFISLHADALEEGEARGATIYTLAERATDAASAALAERHDRDDLLAGLDLTGSDDVVADVLLDLARLENAPRSAALAEAVLQALRNAVGAVNNRPLRRAGFSVLKAADIPSILIEAGFLSTESDLRNLNDPAWRAGFAAGLRDGLQAWAVSDAADARLRRR